MKFGLAIYSGLAFYFACAAAMANDLVVVPMQNPDDVSMFINQVIDTVKLLGGGEWLAAVAACCTLIVGSMKIPGIREKLWDKLTVKGFKLQVFVAPLVGLIGGIISLKIETGHIQLRPVLAYLAAGSGAIILYELLDAVKLTVATNKVASSVIGGVQGVLKKDKA